jgi:peptidyl-prolyl cis-trans isomerase SurA
MKKILAAALVLAGFNAPAQTLFYYGKDSVSVNDFLRAYSKNNTGPKTPGSLTEYLDLFIVSRLKIHEAKEKGYDTLPQLRSDLDNLRQQVLPAYLTDKNATERLAEEAFQRGQKDVHIAHIFISIALNGEAGARQKLADAQAKLKANTDFSIVAKQYSDDPSAKDNGGDLGYITAFTLPYALENLAYQTPVGGTSAVYQSRAGYHIFKNLGERRDPGRMKAAQILLAFPPDADEKMKADVKRRADSVYNRLVKGEEFGKLATAVSNDVVSSASNGQMVEFGTGQYSEKFEKEVFALAKDGAYTKPFLTAHGYHIVKRISISPSPAIKDEKTMESLRSKVEASDRSNSTKTELAERIRKTAGYKRMPDEAQLWEFSDSILAGTHPNRIFTLKNSSPVFILSHDTVSVSDFISYAQTFRYKSDGTGVKSYPVLWDEFVESMVIDYYQRHLEEFNPEFKYQIAEFQEGNLFFEIMQQKVWGPAQSDSAALENYFNAHRSNYSWKKSADAVIFYASDPETAKTYIQQLKKSPSSWHTSIGAFSEKIAADSGRFELTQIPNPKALPLRPGTITEPLVNKTDNTSSFAYVIRNHDQAGPRTFAEARGLVVNDYQNELEKQWITELKKKYPVRINQQVLEDLKRKQAIAKN